MKTTLPNSAVDAVLRCAFCGSTEKVEHHHVGGRKHAPWFTIPLCQEQHREMTRALANSGVQMSYSSDKIERSKQALRALAVFIWQLAEQL